MTPAIFFSVVGIHLAAAISPGPSFVVALRTASAEGFAVAAAMAVGFGCGAALWAVAAMAGMALLFELIPALFSILKLVGAGFLLFTGLMMWRHATTPMNLANTGKAPRSALSAVRFGFLTFAANPKAALFFSAVFVGLVPVDTSLTWKIAIIVAVFLNETLWYILVARVFSLARPRAVYLRAKTWIDRGFGSLIALFGLKIAFS